MLIDETTDTAAHHYRLTQTHHLDGHTIRVRVHRGLLRHQSWAAAEVLTAALTWTELATAPASDWHPATPRSGLRRPTAWRACGQRPTTSPSELNGWLSTSTRPSTWRGRMRHLGGAGTVPSPRC